MCIRDRGFVSREVGQAVAHRRGGIINRRTGELERRHGTGHRVLHGVQRAVFTLARVERRQRQGGNKQHDEKHPSH